MGRNLYGIPVGTGLAAGPLYRVAPPPRLPEPMVVSDVDTELARASAALAVVADDLTRRAGQATDRTAAEILGAQAMMAADPVLAEAVAAYVRAGSDAPHAIDRALGEHRAAFVAAGGYLAERAADLDDLRDRAVAWCLGRPMPGIPDPGRPFILAATDLAPADTAGLDPTRVLALVTEAGGPTSHTAIVARALGLPAVVRCVGIMAVADGTETTVDGFTGEVVAGVDGATIADVRSRERRRRASIVESSGPGRTADGHPVPLLANIGTARDLTDEAEGVGLFRTELLYLDRTTAPTVAEQVEAYAEVFEAAAGRRVVVRTLDAGADKPLPFLHQEGEANPALGVRGLRLGRRDPLVVGTQVEAIAEAARKTGADVWVMAPMVATAAEAAGFVDLCRAAGLPRAGVMVEIPAAALGAAGLARVVDFVSIGSNDLSQYAFAADRMCGDLADLLDPWQPALLRLIAMCAEAMAAAGRPVGLCGEAAADPRLAPVLVGLGVTSLSMSARAIPAVRAALADHTLADCRRLAQEALVAGS